MAFNFDKYDNKTIQLLGTPYDLSKKIMLNNLQNHFIVII